MYDGWTAKGEHNGNNTIYRIEESEEGFYLFVFIKDEQVPFIDELQDSLTLAQESAMADWGASSDWVKEKWELSYC